MRLLVLIFFILAGSYQSLAQKKDYDATTTILNESKKIVDSLLSSGADTLISYYQGNAGCPASISPVAIIYWIRYGSTSLAVLKEQTIFKKNKRRHTGYYIHYYTGTLFHHHDIMSYFENNFGRIVLDTTGTGCRKGKSVYIANYMFEVINAKVGNKNLNYTVESFCRQYQPESYKIKFIDSFRSFILGCIN